jgi:uncharacterized protein YbaR (Trm112 family)
MTCPDGSGAGSSGEPEIGASGAGVGGGPARGAPLVCPSCTRAFDASERFCPECGMPLVHSERDAPAASERRLRARKIKPQYAEGELVKVARAQNQSEAELIEGILLEEGIPCMLRRSRGFDVPDMLAAGPRDVLVPASGAQAAREALVWDGSSPTADTCGDSGAT